MLRLALFFFIVSIIAGILGFTGIAGASADIAKFIFFCFLVVCALMLVAGVWIIKR